MKIDREPVASTMNALVERLRTSRESTHRKAMLLSADFATPHRSAVLAYDAANEIGLGIVIAPHESAGPSAQPTGAAAAPRGSSTRRAILRTSHLNSRPVAVPAPFWRRSIQGNQRYLDHRAPSRRRGPPAGCRVRSGLLEYRSRCCHS